MRIILFFAYFVTYLMGFAAQVLLEAKSSISSKSNGLGSLKDWINLHALDLIPRLMIALGLAPAAIAMVPDAGKLPVSCVYFIGGFGIDRVASSLLFIKGRQSDTPLNSPPPGDKAP
jgi:hypothetical protein